VREENKKTHQQKERGRERERERERTHIDTRANRHIFQCACFRLHNNDHDNNKGGKVWGGGEARGRNSTRIRIGMRAFHFSSIFDSFFFLVKRGREGGWQGG